MKKLQLKSLGLFYWLGNDPSPDGLPVFTIEEVEKIRASKDLISKELMLKIYEMKQVLGVSLDEVSRILSEKEPVREEIGYKAPAKPTPAQLALDYGNQIRGLLLHGKKDLAKKKGDAVNE